MNPTPPAAIPQELGQRPPGRPIAVWKTVAVIVVVTVLAVAGLVVNRVLVSRVDGAGSATESVEEFLSALEDKDWTALVLLLPPDEIYQLTGLFDDTADIQRRAGLARETVDDQLDGVEIDVSELVVSSESVSGDLAKVSIDRAQIVVTVDAKAVESFAEQIPELDTEDLGAIEVTISIDGPEIGYSFVSDTERDSDSDTFMIGGRPQPPFLMSVQRDGSWYVSPTFTVAHGMAEESGWEADDPGVSEVTYDSPQAAADGFVEGLITTIETSDVNHVAEAMGGVESRLLRTYASGINSELDLGDDFGAGKDAGLEIRDTDYTVTPGENGQARITVDGFRATARDDGSEVDVVFDGDCLRVVSESDVLSGSDVEDEGGCISDGGEFATRLYAELGHVVAVPADGGWKISPVATFVDWIGLIQKQIAGLDTELLKALTQRDFSGIVTREPDATLHADDDEVMVEVAAVSGVVHAGIAVVEPEPTDELVDFACDVDAAEGFCEVIVVDRDGRIQDRESSYDHDSPDDHDSYGYGYEVSTGTRLIVVSVAGEVTVERERP